VDGTRVEIGSDEYYKLLPPHRNCLGHGACRCIYVYVMKDEVLASDEEGMQLHGRHNQKSHGFRKKGGVTAYREGGEYVTPKNLLGNQFKPLEPSFRDDANSLVSIDTSTNMDGIRTVSMFKAIRSTDAQVKALQDLSKNKEYVKDLNKVYTAGRAVDKARKATAKAQMAMESGKVTINKQMNFDRALKRFQEKSDELDKAHIKVADYTVKAIGGKGIAAHPKKLTITSEDVNARQLSKAKQRANDARDRMNKISIGSPDNLGYSVHVDRGNRASFTNSAGRNSSVLNISNTSRFPTLAHEMGHATEFMRPGGVAASRAFLKVRTGNETFMSLRKVSGNDNYGAGEVGKSDSFGRAASTTHGNDKAVRTRATYSGKYYPDATEIMSMGTELLFRNPAGFARADPEWAGFTIAMHRGEFD
jgi:hypothetical protein